MDRYIPKPKEIKTPKFPSAAKMAAVSERAGPRKTVVNAFQVAQFPIKAMPPKKSMAMDSNVALCANLSWAASVIASSWGEGLQFLGYPYLAELTQRPEYRVITETIAGEMTRKWGKFEAVGNDDGKTERIKELTKAFEELEVKDNLRTIAEQDGYFGRSHLYLDFGDTDDRDEMALPVGDGKNSISRAKIGKNKPLQRIKPVEAMWAYPLNYDTVDPLKPDWYNPQQWYTMARPVHSSRLLRFVGREVPDMLKPAYAFGGLSLSQIAKPYVDNWLTTRQSVNDLIHSFVVWGLKTNLAESLSMRGEQLFQRIELFNRLRDNRGCMLTDKDTEEFFNVTAPLGTLDALQAQSQEHMASVSRIPLVKLLGIQPAGLNASSEGEIRVFYDTIAEYQEKFFRKNLMRIVHFTMLSLWDEVDPEITFKFEPLWSLDEKQEAEVRKTDAETGQILVQGGIVDQSEERKRVAEDPGTPYAGLDKSKLPDLNAEIEGGLVPEGGGKVTAELEEGGNEDPSERMSDSEEDEGEDSDAVIEGTDLVASKRQERTGKLVNLVHKVGQKRERESTPQDDARKPRTGKLTKLLKVLDAAE